MFILQPIFYRHVIYKYLGGECFHSPPKIAKVILSTFLVFFVISSLYGQSLDQEAEDQHKKIIDGLYLKKDDNSYSSITYNGYGDSKDVHVYELNFKSTKLAKDILSHADKLNFFEWKGELQIDCKAFRAFRYGKWSEWSTPVSPVIIKLRKKRGTWRHYVDKGTFIGKERPSLELVDKLLKLPMEDSY